MYLRSLYIENNGPLKSLSLQLPFNEDGSPKPVLLVGSNGTGKTNLLSIIADSLFEAAAKHYQNVFPGGGSINRPFFRVVGAVNTTVGARSSFSILKFIEGEAAIFSTRRQERLRLRRLKTEFPPS